MQKIGIDCRLAGVRHAGIGRYTENLVKRLPDLSNSIEWVFFFTDQAQAEQVLGQQLHHPHVEVVLAPVRHYSLAEQQLLPKIFDDAKLDLLHVPHFNIPLLYQGKLVITIHDLLWHEYRGLGFTTLSPWLYHFKYFAYRFIVSQAVRKASKIIVPAETIRQTLLSFYPNLKNKVVVTKEGIDDRLLSSSDVNLSSTQNKLPDSKEAKILLYVGSLYPHKNLKLVIDALSELPEYQLWVVGTRNVFQERIQAYVQQKNVTHQVKFLGYVNDAQLTEVFQQVTALVQPSLSEGFGLTGVEAMAAHLPVLASQIPIFKEIYQAGALYFDPNSVPSFIAAVRRLSHLDSTQWYELLTQATSVAGQYSWDAMAQETLHVYQQVLQ